MILKQNDYKNAMDKIVVSDELKEKIVQKCSSDTLTFRKKQKNYKQLRTVLSAAACFAFCALTLLAVNSRYPLLFNTSTDPISDNKSVDSADNEPDLSTDSTLESDHANNSLSSTDSITQEIQTENDGLLWVNSSTENQTSGIYRTVEEAETAVGHALKIPHIVPESYTIDSVTVSAGELTEILYADGNGDVLYYRTARSSTDISGVYTVYDNTETLTERKYEITVKGNNDQYYIAVWHRDDDAFSIYCPQGLGKSMLTDMAESVS